MTTTPSTAFSITQTSNLASKIVAKLREVEPTKYWTLVDAPVVEIENQVYKMRSYRSTMNLDYVDVTNQEEYIINYVVEQLRTLEYGALVYIVQTMVLPQIFPEHGSGLVIPFISRYAEAKEIHQTVIDSEVQLSEPEDKEFRVYSLVDEKGNFIAGLEDADLDSVANVNYQVMPEYGKVKHKLKQTRVFGEYGIEPLQDSIGGNTEEVIRLKAALRTTLTLLDFDKKYNVYGFVLIPYVDTNTFEYKVILHILYSEVS